VFTLSTVLERNATQHGSRPAVLDEQPRSWADTVERVRRAAAGLASLGIHRGDRYSLLGRNSPQQAELIHAGYWSGAIPVPVNMRLAPPEIAHILTDAGCKAVFVEQAFEALFEAPELAPWRARCVRLGSGGFQCSEELIAGGEPADRELTSPDDVALLVYTGGTTGRGKGVPLTHENIVANGLQMIAATGVTGDDVYLHVAPMFHSADLLGTAHTLQGAAHAYLAQPTPTAALEAVQRHGVTGTMMPPVLVKGLVSVEDPSRYDVSSLRWLIYGSAPMDPRVVREARRVWPRLALYQGYGLTETSPILTLLAPSDHDKGATEAAQLLRSVGRPLVGVELTVADEHGNRLPAGTTGEVLVRGPNVLKGYWNRPEDDAASFVAGWFRTGDAGYLDASGYLFLVDRVKDIIVTGGENVYSSEVELVLREHPAVGDVAVIGVPDPDYGEALLAVIVPADEPPSIEQLIEHCRPHIGGYKIPRKMIVLEQLPRSAVGKVLKAELRRSAAGGETAP
jgi:long-chain acyl-CoA synthetase